MFYLPKCKKKKNTKQTNNSNIKQFCVEFNPSNIIKTNV